MWTESEVEKIIIESKKATGLIGKRHTNEGQSTEIPLEFRIRANIEGILSAGALSSPKLLMLRYAALQRLIQERDLLTSSTVVSVRKMNSLNMAFPWC